LVQVGEETRGKGEEMIFRERNTFALAARRRVERRRKRAEKKKQPEILMTFSTTYSSFLSTTF